VTAVSAALEALGRRFPARRRFVVLSVFGHRSEDLAALHAALQAGEAFFWLHDYSALCEGFNLLRNDVAYCHAPPAESTACRVCVYGARRQRWLAGLARLFEAVPFHVLAPGRAALDLFLARSALPFLSARVQENAALVALDDAASPHADDPVRVGFLGFAMPQKGWAAFQRLVAQNAGRSAYRFHHFAIPAAHTDMTGLENVAVQVTPGDRMAAVRALRAARIDLLLVLSPWPETFSFVVHEAFAAGADVVALADGGNVADAVRRHRRGVVLADEAALQRFFAEGWALDYARQRALAPAGALAMVPGGATAGVEIAAPLGSAWAAA
jgi:glycosyltransferase involved in cell wall biosynthesis